MGDTVDLPKGKKISGYEIVEPLEDTQYTEYTYRSGNSTIKCSVPYCPNCSTNREKDTRQGGYREKWTVKQEDYETALVYKEDESGFYAVCSKCGHDVRNHESKHDSYISIFLDEKTEDGPPLPEVWLNDVVYQEGFFIIPYSEYERVRQQGTKDGGQILPTAKIDDSRYLISWDDYLTKMRAVPNVSIVGIPRIYWKAI